MLDNLIEIGKSYKDKFTKEYSVGSTRGISSNLKSEYILWLSKIGMFAESKLRNDFPGMTEQILNIVKGKSIYDEDYSLIIGYLESAKELGY
ncbi:hypothetical protein Z965_02380 [Clostridium novyi A str. BKT29909]|uniref:hypothetical protein n=1 Tax=Clostridium novyi TaxID=1542 RepID=UPI0004D92F5F|nr:hypothetical protein [Clostridium novyi]KEH89609.1 hypothetical protein Z965_02380 [Clostridium novyi A str. BKT29909]